MPAPTMNDWELLREYAERKSERAFELLVNRYVDLVYSTALRCVANAHLAEEVSQAVFLILARKADNISRRTSIAGWIFRTTRFVSARAIRTEQRRRLREDEAAAMPTTSPPQWTDIEPMLDEALAQLPNADRDALLLRFFQRKSLREIGEVMATSEEAARKRVTRAVEKLRNILAPHGRALSAAALATVLAKHAVHAAPADLTSAIQAAAAAGEGALPASLTELVNHSVRTLGWSKRQLGFALAACLLGVAFLGIVNWRGTSSNEQSRDAASVQNSAATVLASPTSQSIGVSLPAKSSATLASLPIRVVDAKTTLPMPRTRVLVRHVARNATSLGYSLELATDEFGVCLIPFSVPESSALHLWVISPGYVPIILGWEEHELRGELEEYIVRLERGRTLSGMVLDRDRQPIDGARITPSSLAGRFAQRELVAYQSESSDVFSDAAGRWRFDAAPSELDSLTLFAMHPDFVRAKMTFALTDSGTNLEIVMERGLSVRGTVVNERDLPVAEATILQEHGLGGPSVTTKTDSFGEFVLGQVMPGVVTVRIAAEGYQELSRAVVASTNGEPLRFILARMPEAPVGKVAAETKWESKTTRIAGRVNDAETGKPVNRFNVIMMNGTFVGEGRNGSFDWEYSGDGTDREYDITIEAEGYRLETAPPIRVGSLDRILEFKLSSSDGIHGAVVTPEGRPVAQAEVFVGGEGFGPMSSANSATLGKVVVPGQDQRTRTLTDTEGRFSFKPTRLANRLIVVHASGSAAVRLAKQGAQLVVLQPWGELAGVLRVGAAVGSSMMVGLQNDDSDAAMPSVPYSNTAVTDSLGRFRFDHLPPGRYLAFRITNSRKGSTQRAGQSHFVVVEVRPGEVSEVTLGGMGRTVIGRIETIPSKILPYWATELQSLAANQPGLNRPTLTKMELRDSSSIEAYYSALARFDRQRLKYFFVLKPDASFVIDDVLPGNYVLDLKMRESDENFLLGSLTMEAVVPSGPDEQPVDLGVITVRLK